MPTMTQVINENSEKFLPAFARLRTSAEGTSSVYGPLEFRFRGTSPLAAPGETEVGRWVAVCGCIITVTDAGLPFQHAPDGTTGRPAKLFEGGAELLLTNRRLLGVVVKGDTIVGNVNDEHGNVLIFSLPLNTVDSVSVDLGRRLFGGAKEKRLHVMSLPAGMTDVFIDSVVAVPGSGPKGYERYRGTLRDVLEAFVAPVVAARRPAADESEQRQLGAAARGVREQSEDEVAVSFSAD